MKFVPMGPNFIAKIGPGVGSFFHDPGPNFTMKFGPAGPNFLKFSMKIGPGGPNFMVANFYMTQHSLISSDKRRHDQF